MNMVRERVLLVEHDPEVCDLISRQTLQPLGYRVAVVRAASQAIQEAVKFAPDVILVNLSLPDLSGKDLLVAFSSQGLEVPIIVMTEKGMENDVIQAFRLGASDYLTSPIREAEVVSAVERVLKQVRARRERESLTRQLNKINEELHRRVRELTTIFALGKAVTSITDQRALLNKIVEGALFITEADYGWILLRAERGKAFILSACGNLPKTISDKIDQPWEDGISSLVALSGESLSIYGEPLKRFKIAFLGQSALVVPIKAKKEVIGAVVVVRKMAKPFSPSSQTLLEAVADYASISLLNTQLFKALEERARSLQQAADMAHLNERIKDDILKSISDEIKIPLKTCSGQVRQLLDGQMGIMNENQIGILRQLQSKMENLTEVLGSMSSWQPKENIKQKTLVDLNELTRQVMARFQRIAHISGETLFAEFSSSPVYINANPALVTRVLEGLLSNAIKYSHRDGIVTVRVDLKSHINTQYAHVIVKDNGIGIDKSNLTKIFESSYSSAKTATSQFGGGGISLALIHEILVAHGGKVWVESEPGKGSTFHFVLVSVRNNEGDQ